MHDKGAARRIDEGAGHKGRLVARDGQGGRAGGRRVQLLELPEPLCGCERLAIASTGEQRIVFRELPLENRERLRQPADIDVFADLHQRIPRLQ